MEKKICRGCGIEMPLSSFHSNGENGLRAKCKSCERNRKIAERYFYSHIPCVYYLPEEHYIGVTNNFRSRISKHKQKGKIVEGAEIIAYFQRYVDAMYLEVMFHQRGYNGCNFGNSNN